MWELTNLSPQPVRPKTVNASRGQEEKRDLSLYSDTYAAILYK